MADSILNDTKKVLGVAETDTSFDLDLIMHINAVLSTLHQLGVGPTDGYSITGDSETWDEFLFDDPRMNSVRSYVYLRVKMLFDPPSVGYVLTAMEKMILEAEWRITVAQDEITNPPTTVTVVESTDIFD